MISKFSAAKSRTCRVFEMNDDSEVKIRKEFMADLRDLQREAEEVHAKINEGIRRSEMTASWNDRQTYFQDILQTVVRLLEGVDAVKQIWAAKATHQALAAELLPTLTRFENTWVTPLRVSAATGKLIGKGGRSDVAFWN